MAKKSSFIKEDWCWSFIELDVVAFNLKDVIAIFINSTVLVFSVYCFNKWIFNLLCKNKPLLLSFFNTYMLIRVRFKFLLLAIYYLMVG